MTDNATIIILENDTKFIEIGKSKNGYWFEILFYL